MLEYCFTLVHEFFRAHRHAHLYIFDGPFGPRSAIHPDAAIVEPFGAGFLYLLKSGENGFGAFAVSSMWIGQIGCHINLMWPDLLDKLLDDVDVGLCHRKFFDASALVEREVEEVDMGERNFIECAGRAGLPAAYEAFDVENVACVGLALFLSGEEFFTSLYFSGIKSQLRSKIWLNPLTKCMKRVASSSATAIFPEVS